METVITKEELKELPESESPKKKKKGLTKFIIYISLVLVATGIALFLALYKDPKGVINALADCDYRWVLVIFAVEIFSFVVDGLVIYIFMRLYTRKYHLHQGLAISMIGSFYGSITPGAKGGQVMQAYTLRNQGTQISNAASILVMYFILYNVAVIIFDMIAVIFKFNLFKAIGSVPITLGSWSANLSLIPLTIIGFVFSLSVIGILFLMSYSHRMHNFVMHYGVGFLARIKILKHPDQTRESLRIQVENFKIELRRLLSNIPITITILLLLFIGLMCDYSIPWFAGMAVNGYGYTINAMGEIVHTTGYASVGSMFDACFLSCYHQMISGLIPIPGGAGISEILFSKLFENYYTTATAISASQILWRASTFYFVMLVCGLVTAFYKASPKKQAIAATDRKTFVTMQFETYEERKQSSDASFNGIQVHRQNEERIKQVVVPKTSITKKKQPSFALDDDVLNEDSPFKVDRDLIQVDDNKKKKKKASRDWDGFDLWVIR